MRDGEINGFACNIIILLIINRIDTVFIILSTVMKNIFTIFFRKGLYDNEFLKSFIEFSSSNNDTTNFMRVH